MLFTKNIFFFSWGFHRIICIPLISFTILVELLNKYKSQLLLADASFTITILLTVFGEDNS